jgi:23S rRNA (guanine745-N1)-methyltransferase
VAAAGYTHLLPANQKNSKNPGDDKAMVAARTAFLDAGYYTPLREALCAVTTEALEGKTDCAVLDCGCGEGYYTAGIAGSANAAIAGIDISKFALKKAAKRCPAGEFAVASAYRLPLEDGSIGLLLNIFSPLAAEEFYRVLKPGGVFVYAVPSAKHLWQMKQVLYDRPYENEVRREDYPGFRWVGVEPVRETITLQTSQHIMALFGMTPYAWKTPKEGVDKLRTFDTLDTQIGFDVHIYQKT